jgi:GTPase SAR1 family protein
LLAITKRALPLSDLFEGYTILRVESHAGAGGAIQVEIELCNTKGEKDYWRPMRYPYTDVFIICYSIVDRASFISVETAWKRELEYHAAGVPVVLWGLKSDLRFQEQYTSTMRPPVTSEEGYKLAKSIGASAFVELSSKTREGLSEAFEQTVPIALRPKQANPPALYVSKPVKKMLPALVYTSTKKKKKTLAFLDRDLEGLLAHREDASADVAFRFGADVSIYAHKLVLVTSSTFFMNLFSGSDTATSPFTLGVQQAQPNSCHSVQSITVDTA